MPAPHRNSLMVLALLLPAAGLIACSDDEFPAAPGALTVQLSHVVGGAPLVYDDIRYQNAAGDRYSVETLLYYVSRVVLTGPAGDFETDVVHYCDADDPATRTLTIPDVPGGSYDGIRFIFGLNEEDNVTDGLPATAENINMAWPEPMGGGYHYMKLEGKFIRSGETQERTYRTHMGRNMMTPHFFTVALPFPAAAAVDGNWFEVRVVMDLNEWYANPNPYAFPDDAMIMGNMAVQNLLAQNGATVFSLGAVTSGD